MRRSTRIFARIFVSLIIKISKWRVVGHLFQKELMAVAVPLRRVTSQDKFERGSAVCDMPISNIAIGLIIDHRARKEQERDSM